MSVFIPQFDAPGDPKLSGAPGPGLLMVVIIANVRHILQLSFSYNVLNVYSLYVSPANDGNAGPFFRLSVCNFE